MPSLSTRRPDARVRPNGRRGAGSWSPPPVRIALEPTASRSVHHLWGVRCWSVLAVDRRTGVPYSPVSFVGCSMFRMSSLTVSYSPSIACGYTAIVTT